VPAVHSLFCPVTDEMEGRRRWLLSKKTARRNLARVDRIIAASRNIETSLVEAGIDASRIRRIPPAIDTASFSPEISGTEWRKKLEAPEDARIVFYLGNLTPVKGLDIAIEALREVAAQATKRRRKTPGLYFVYVLQGNHPRFDRRGEEFKKALASIPLAGVRALGPVPHIERLMAAADLFIAPLRSTNGLADLPVSIMEGMALGKPIITTPVGGVPEIVTDGETGLFVPPDSAAALAEKMQELLDSPELAAWLGANAREFALSTFGLEHVAQQTLEVYEELL
jgi:glycosyltransferase involved in cell wall biosynthesis